MEHTIILVTAHWPDLDAIGKQQQAEREAYEHYRTALLAYLAVHSALANSEGLQSGERVLSFPQCGPPNNH